MHLELKRVSLDFVRLAQRIWQTMRTLVSRAWPSSARTHSTINFEEISAEVLVAIFMRCLSEDRVRLRQVCRLWHQLCPPNFDQINLVSGQHANIFLPFYAEHLPLNFVSVDPGLKPSHWYPLDSLVFFHVNKQKKEKEMNVRQNVEKYRSLIHQLSICGEFLSGHFVDQQIARFPNLTSLDLNNFYISENFLVFFSKWMQRIGPHLERFRIGLMGKLFTAECFDLILEHLNPTKLKALGIVLRNETQLVAVCRQFPLLTDLEIWLLNFIVPEGAISLIVSKTLLPHLKCFSLVNFVRWPFPIRPAQFWRRDSIDFLQINHIAGFLYSRCFSHSCQFNNLRCLDTEITSFDFFKKICFYLKNLETFRFKIAAEHLEVCVQHLALLKILKTVSIQSRYCRWIKIKNRNWQKVDFQPLVSVRFLTFRCICLHALEHCDIRNPNFKKCLLSFFPNIQSLIIGQQNFTIKCFDRLMDHSNKMRFLKKIRLLLRNYSQRMGSLRREWICLEKYIQLHNQMSDKQVEIIFLE